MGLFSHVVRNLAESALVGLYSLSDDLTEDDSLADEPADQGERAMRFLCEDGDEDLFEDDGTHGYRYSDGSAAYYGADGSWGYRNSDGSINYYGEDGSWGYINEDGSGAYWDAAGNCEIRDSDGNVY